jgi:hypothetical protein
LRDVSDHEHIGPDPLGGRVLLDLGEQPPESLMR